MRGLRPALVIATVLAAIAAIDRLLDQGRDGLPVLRFAAGQPADAWIPLLVAAGALCVAGLSIRRSTWLAWFATGAAAAIASIDLIAQIRAVLADAPATAWPLLVAVAAIAGILTTGICTTLLWNAGRVFGGRKLAWAAGYGGAFGFLAVVVAEGYGLTAAFNQAPGAVDPSSTLPIRAVNRVLLAVLAGELAAAAAFVVLHRARRAWARSRPRFVPTHGPDSRAGRFAAALADEFVPGLAVRTHRAAADERERLAADLHARVLPGLRRAADSRATPDAGGRADLRAALDDLETMMAERHSVILESFGLVPALEWLAERAQARGSKEVSLEIGDLFGDEGAPRDVERTAFQIALLAVDNAGRHAPGVPISIAVASTPRALDLEVADSGPGIDADAVRRARLAGHRGLADMEAAALAAGGRLDVSVITEGVGQAGTRVRFTWAAR